MIRVMLADDQRVVREGLGTLLGLLDGIELVGTAADGAEAVELARRHAAPDRVTIRLAYEADGARLSIEDAGVAVPVAAAPSPGGGFGLTGMRERAELLGGELAAGPTADGFRVELWLPR